MNKQAIIGLVGLLFAIASIFHIALPPEATHEAVTTVAMLAIAAITAIVRFGQGDVAADAKTWWQSRTIWTQIVAAVFALLVILRVNPVVDQQTGVAIAMALSTGVTFLLSFVSKKPIG